MTDLWKIAISESGKAFYFNKFKSHIAFEPHLNLKHILRHKIAISHHLLMIEKGRHDKPEKIDANERKCYFLQKLNRKRRTFYREKPTPYSPKDLF